MPIKTHTQTKSTEKHNDKRFGSKKKGIQERQPQETGTKAQGLTKD